MTKLPKGQPNSPRVLIFDIETSPLLSWTWGTYQTDVIKVIQDFQVLCFSYKWLSEKKVYHVTQPDFKDYRVGKINDKSVVEALHELFEQADVLIAHNGDRFDIKKTNARLAFHKYLPPLPSQSIDTLKVARNSFAFTSNRLDDLGEFLGVGRKVKHEGFILWEQCMNGDKKAWKKMRKYNDQDVVLLEKIYLELRPWIKNHPNINVLSEAHVEPPEGRPEACVACNSTYIVAGTKYKATNSNLYQYFRCMGCGKPMKRRLSENIAKPTYSN